MGAPSPELSNLWLARAFNAQDVEASAALYHPDAAIVQVDEVHRGTVIARGAAGIRADLQPHMDVVTHHVTLQQDRGARLKVVPPLHRVRLVLGCAEPPRCEPLNSRNVPSLTSNKVATSFGSGSARETYFLRDGNL